MSTLEFISTYTDFIDTLLEKLNGLGIDSSTLVIDHLGYQADSKTDYDLKTSQLSEIATKVSENLVGGRRVGIFKLHTPLQHKEQRISVVEVFEPKEGQVVKSAWEHIEFLVNESLEDFVKRYKEVNWDTAMLNREEFPQLILPLGDGLRAKFPRLGVLDEIKRVSDSSGNEPNLVSQHFELLKGTLFTDITELPAYNLVKGFLTDSIWNYVIPKTTHDQIDFNEIETVVNKYKDERDFSVYVPVELQTDYDKFLLSMGYKLESVDTYIFRKLDSEFRLSLEEGETFEEVTKESYEDYLAQTKLAFPEWDNEEHYTNMFFKLGHKFEDKELRNFVIRNAEDIICFGSVISSKSLNLAYFHNSGTNPKYRRKGYFTKLKGFMCDYVYSQGVDRVYALVEENGGSHKALSQIGFEVNTKYYIYDK